MFWSERATFESKQPPGNTSENNFLFTAKYAVKYLGINRTQQWPNLDTNTDLNPMEMLWRDLKYHLQKVVKPHSKKELVKGICSFWSNVPTQEKCKEYINQLQVIIPAIVEREASH